MGTFLAFPSDILTTLVSWRCVTCCSAEVTRQSCSHAGRADINPFKRVMTARQ